MRLAGMKPFPAATAMDRAVAQRPTVIFKAFNPCAWPVPGSNCHGKGRGAASTCDFEGFQSLRLAGLKRFPAASAMDTAVAQRPTVIFKAFNPSVWLMQILSLICIEMSPNASMKLAGRLVSRPDIGPQSLLSNQMQTLAVKRYTSNSYDDKICMNNTLTNFERCVSCCVHTSCIA